MTLCVCCQKNPGTDRVWNGDAWCRPCLERAHAENAENAAMCRTFCDNEELHGDFQ